MILRRMMGAGSVIALLLAAAHLGLAAASAGRWGLPLLWFAGSGLALLLAGLLNVVALRSGSEDRVVKAAWLLGNGAVTGFFLLAWPLLKQPQVLIGILVFALLTVAACFVPTRPAMRNPASSAPGPTPG